MAYRAIYYDLNGMEAGAAESCYPGSVHELDLLKTETYDEGGYLRYYPAVKIEGGHSTLFYRRRDQFTDDGNPCDEVRRVSRADFERWQEDAVAHWLAEADRINEQEMWGPRGRPGR